MEDAGKEDVHKQELQDDPVRDRHANPLVPDESQKGSINPDGQDLKHPDDLSPTRLRS